MKVQKLIELLQAMPAEHDVWVSAGTHCWYFPQEVQRNDEKARVVLQTTSDPERSI
jgi:hypothetical protein